MNSIDPDPLVRGSVILKPDLKQAYISEAKKVCKRDWEVKSLILISLKLLGSFSLPFSDRDS